VLLVAHVGLFVREDGCLKMGAGGFARAHPVPHFRIRDGLAAKPDEGEPIDSLHARGASAGTEILIHRAGLADSCATLGLLVRNEIVGTEVEEPGCPRRDARGEGRGRVRVRLGETLELGLVAEVRPVPADVIDDVLLRVSEGDAICEAVLLENRGERVDGIPGQLDLAAGVLLDVMKSAGRDYGGFRIQDRKSIRFQDRTKEKTLPNC